MSPEPKPGPARGLRVPPAGRVVSMSQLTENKGCGRGFQGGARGLLLGTRIPASSLVLQTPGLAGRGGLSVPSGTSQLSAPPLAGSSAAGVPRSGVLRTGAPRLTNGATGRPTGRGTRAEQGSRRTGPSWFIVHLQSAGRGPGRPLLGKAG